MAGNEEASTSTAHYRQTAAAAAATGTTKDRVQNAFTDANATPEEDAAAQVDAARRAAYEQIQARKRTTGSQNGDGDREGGHRTSIWHQAISMVNLGSASPQEADSAHSSPRLTELLGLEKPPASATSGVEGTNEAARIALHHEEEEEEEEESAVSTAFLVSYFVAGGAAGAASRTVVSPLERLKIIMQVQPKSQAGGKSARGAYSGVVSGLMKMWQEEGFKGYMRGNGINCLRIAPYSAVQFSTYEVLKNYLKQGEEELDVPKRLFAGALAGIASVVSTYPLDLVRSRISIASASMYAEAKDTTQKLSEKVKEGGGADGQSAKKKLSRTELRRIIEERQKKIPGIWGMTVKVYNEEGGIRALYKGCVPTSLGVAPYVGINFAAYEVLRKRLADEEGEISTARKLFCGALAGSISQTLTYPLDVLRRRMQVSGMKDSRLGYSDKNAWAAVRTILKAEGFWGLYRGIVPNLLKVAPSIGTSFATYEFVRNLVHPPHHHHHGHH